MKRFGMKIFTMMAAAVVLAAGIVTGCQKSNEISLKDLKTGDEYQYAKAAWNASLQEVEKRLPYSIEKDEARASGSSKYVPYKSENKITLDGYEAVVTFEFCEDELKMISFNFDLPDENYKEQFETQVERLIQQFGPESEKMESSDGFNEITYVWKTQNTALQLDLLTGEALSPRIELSMADKSVGF